MSATYQKKALLMPNVQTSTHSDLSIKRKPRPKRSYFDVGIGSVCGGEEDLSPLYGDIRRDLRRDALRR